MSIDSEVTSMTQNIQADYEGLENIGADLTGINKNILNIRTILDTIYNDMPKVTGEGTEVTLSPTRKGRLALIPKGNSTQESTNGYQLWNFKNGTYTSAGITAVVSNGEISLSGTALENAFVIVPLNTNITWSSGNYTISANNGVANSDIRIRVNSNGGKDTTLDSINKTNTITYSGEGDIFSDRINIRVQSGTAISGTFKFKPMLETGSTAHSWEPYTRRNICTKSRFPTKY